MFSKSCEYGIRGVLFLAMHHHQETKVSVKEMADTLAVPRHFLAKILQQLSRAGLISSIKGPGGGFYLSEENLSQSLIDIIQAIDGDVLNSCILGLERCSSEEPCPLHFQVYSFREGLRLQLSHQSIAGLARNLTLDQIKSIEK
jgi:Rrf2 family iron-sulfur cluster assembly transcriptional regulator